MMLSGCSICCEPTGRLLWNGTPHSVSEISESIDGVMGGIECTAGWTR